MRVFTKLPLRHWREAAPAAQAAETAGFDAVMTVELGHDVFTPLAFAALATQRIELTPSIAVAFPRSPTILAHQAWDLHANSSGRFVLGLGVSHIPMVEGLRGHRYDKPVATMRAYLEALHKGLPADRAAPVVVAALGPRMRSEEHTSELQSH